MDLSEFENSDVNKKLRFLAQAYITLHNEIVRRRLPSEDDILYKIQRLMEEMSKITQQFSKDTKERETFRMPEEFIELVGTMKFIAKHTHEIEKRLAKLESCDVNHKIKIVLDSSKVDNYNMSNKIEVKFDPYQEIDKVLPKDISKVLFLKFGVRGEKHTFKEIASMIGRSPSYTSVMNRKGLYRLSKPVHKKIVQNLPDSEFKTAIVKYIKEFRS